MTSITFAVALIIVTIILPGGIFRRGFLSSEFSNYHLRASNFSEIVFTLGVGMFSQTIGILILKYVIRKYYVDFGILGQILAAPDRKGFEKIGLYATEIFIYNLLLCVACFIAGRGLMFLIITRNWDLRWRALRFDNHWNYIFSGKEFVERKEQEIIKYTNICVSSDDTFIVYTGFLTNYWLDNDGKLEIIELRTVKRKIIERNCISEFEDGLDEPIAENMTKSKGKSTKKPKHTEYKFAIHKLLIPYSQVQNISITYYELEEAPKDEDGYVKETDTQEINS